jgi:hypothetical protein
MITSRIGKAFEAVIPRNAQAIDILDQFARHRLRQKRIRRARIGEQRAQRSIV